MRKGKDFEELIQKLEKIQLPEGAEIQSPGFVKDKITLSMREVDVLISFNVGTIPIKIIIECRDRKKIEDTIWIEQIRTKVEDLNVNKVIAVSSNRFSSQAEKKAKHYGIETRTYSEIDMDSIRSWFLVDFIPYQARHINIFNMSIEFDRIDINPEILVGKNPHTQFLKTCGLNQEFSVHQIAVHFLKDCEIWDSLEPNLDPIRKTVSLLFNEPASRYFLETEVGEFAVIKINCTVEFQLVEGKRSISRINRYQNSDTVFSEVIEFDDLTIGNNDVFQIIKNQDGSLSISARNSQKRGNE